MSAPNNGAGTVGTVHTLNIRSHQTIKKWNWQDPTFYLMVYLICTTWVSILWLGTSSNDQRNQHLTNEMIWKLDFSNLIELEHPSCSYLDEPHFFNLCPPILQKNFLEKNRCKQKLTNVYLHAKEKFDIMAMLHFCQNLMEDNLVVSNAYIEKWLRQKF